MALELSYKGTCQNETAQFFCLGVSILKKHHYESYKKWVWYSLIKQTLTPYFQQDVSPSVILGVKMVKKFKTKLFARWSKKEGITNHALSQAISEIEKGVVDADLGSQLYKKRIARQGQGKSGGFRTLIAFRKKDKAFFLYGFDKGERSNIDQKEKEALKKLSQELMRYSEKELNTAVKQGALILIEVEENE